MKYKGSIRKMKSNLINRKVHYTLPIGEQILELNNLIGEKITFSHTGKINCVHCGKAINKSYAQGYCYQCFSTLPQTDENILHPEKDRSYLGISRDMNWAEKNTLVPHYVYLSFTSNVKVGVTRCSQIPTRWIDQGAIEAIILAKTPNRHIAGTIEVFLKDFFADKTNWKQMLSDTSSLGYLSEEKEKATKFLHDEFLQYVTLSEEITKIEYPVSEYPDNPTTINLDKNKLINRKKMLGIKGQYLIFEDNIVLNIRKYSGYEIDLNID